MAITVVPVWKIPAHSPDQEENLLKLSSAKKITERGALC